MVLEMGVAAYNAECRGIVQRYTKEWEKTVNRLGRWIDFENGYKTMDPNFMESVWWVFKTMFEKDLVYRGYKVMPYSMAWYVTLITEQFTYVSISPYHEQWNASIQLRGRIELQGCE